MDFSRQEFKDLIFHAISGEPESVNKFCKIISPYITQCIESKLGKKLRAKTTVDALVNEVLVKVQNGLTGHDFNGGAQFKVWLRTICKAQLSEKARFLGAKKRNPGGQISLNKEVGDQDHSAKEIGDMVAGSGSTPSGAVLREERASIVREVLSGMPVKFKFVLEMKHFKGLKTKEIAEQLDKPLNTAKKILWNATQEFSKEMKKRKKQIDPDSTVF